MNVERLAAEYVKQKGHLDAISKQVDTLKELLTKAIDTEGTVDDKGHRWLVAGDYVLQRQRRQGKKALNSVRAEEWARESGFWDEVHQKREVLDEDKLLGFVYEHRKDPQYPDIEKALEALYEEPAPTWATMPPVKQKTYDY